MRRVDLPAPLPAGSRILHIGLPKTGTSALQASFHAAREELGRRGVDYVSRGANPLSAARFAAGTATGDTARLERRWDRLAEDFRTSTAAHVVLSSEGFSGAAPDRVAWIGDRLGGEATVVVTLRPVAALLPSIWQQALRRGGLESFEEWLAGVLDPAHPHAANIRRYDPAAIIASWGRRFGEDRLVFVCGDPGDPGDRMLNHRTFESLLGIDGVLELQPVLNSSPPYPEIEMLRHFNLANGRGGEDGELWTRVLRRTARRMGDAPPSGAGTAKVRVPRWAAERINEQARESIAALEASAATVVGDPAHLLVDPADHPVETTAPDQVTVVSAGWFADTVARLAVDEVEERAARKVRRLERKVARLAERRRTTTTLDDASARDLLLALARRARRRSRRGR
ncbi:hypothetical protein RB608_19335 [Nocardioides sp. LHD-245]|uniref:hypothetical protein n=1 Tax=Nocardioides sp. LHD-245 TaxID=3051387 RepID=UPI0027DF5D19|nr:hypothetical protein [Nocardioides sp. LHD-245]